jgi:hypothetical protein
MGYFPSCFKLFFRQDQLDFLFCFHHFPPARHRLRLQARRAGMKVMKLNPPSGGIKLSFFSNYQVSVGYTVMGAVVTL